MEIGFPRRRKCPDHSVFPPKEAMRVCNNPGQVTTAERGRVRAGSRPRQAGRCRVWGLERGGACVRPPVTCAWRAGCGSDGAAFANVYCISSGGLLLGSQDRGGDETHNVDQRSECNEEEQEQEQEQNSSRAAVDCFCVERAESGLVEGGPPFLRVRIEIGPSVNRMNDLGPGVAGCGLRAAGFEKNDRSPQFR